MSEELAQAFVAHGMLCNLTAALGIDESQADTDTLARRMTAPPAVMALLLPTLRLTLHLLRLAESVHSC